MGQYGNDTQKSWPNRKRYLRYCSWWSRLEGFMVIVTSVLRQQCRLGMIEAIFDRLSQSTGPTDLFLLALTPVPTGAYSQQLSNISHHQLYAESETPFPVVFIALSKGLVTKRRFLALYRQLLIEAKRSSLSLKKTTLALSLSSMDERTFANTQSSLLYFIFNSSLFVH